MVKTFFFLFTHECLLYVTSRLIIGNGDLLRIRSSFISYFFLSFPMFTDKSTESESSIYNSGKKDKRKELTVPIIINRNRPIEFFFFPFESQLFVFVVVFWLSLLLPPTHIESHQVLNKKIIGSVFPFYTLPLRINGNYFKDSFRERCCHIYLSLHAVYRIKKRMFIGVWRKYTTILIYFFSS